MMTGNRSHCARLVALVMLLLSGSFVFAAETVYRPLIAGPASVEFAEECPPDGSLMWRRLYKEVCGSWELQDTCCKGSGPVSWTESFTDTGVYRIDGACDNDTGQVPNAGWEVRGVVTVYTASLQVRRSGSADEFKDSAAVAAGGRSPSVHKADVQVQTDPAVSGIPVTVQIRSGEGGLVAASLSIGGITDSSGKISGTFVSSDKIRSVTLEARSDGEVLLDTATVKQQWDDDEGLEFNVPEYFVPEQPDDSTFTCRLTENVPINGHALNYYTYTAKIRSYQWNLTTGEETQSERVYDDPVDDLPFGLDINDLIQHSATTEVKDGVYRNTQTVHDYFDLVEENGKEYWREALVVEYEMAVVDEGIYIH